MNQHNHPDPLSSDLKRLSSPAASADFTERVLSRLDARIERRRRRRAVALSIALPLVVALAGLVIFARPEPETRTAQVEELRQQHQLLQQELARLEQARDRSRAVLYLGTSDDYDLVLDLEPFLDRSVGAPVVPALQELRGQPARVVEASRRQP